MSTNRKLKTLATSKVGTASVSQSQGTGTKASKWTPYKKMKVITIDSAANFGTREFINQYQQIIFILNKLESRSTITVLLKETCNQIRKLAETMKNELPKYREMLTGQELKQEGNDDEDLENDEENNGIQPRKKTAGDGVTVDKDFVIKMFPLLESILYTIHRRLTLITIGTEDPPETTLMMILTGVDLLPLIFSDLKSLVSPLEEIEFWDSKYEANISEKAVKADKKEIIELLEDTLTKLKESGEGETIGIADDIDDILSSIENGQDEAIISSEILDSLKEKLDKIVHTIADHCDKTMSELEEGNLLLEDNDVPEYDDFGEVRKGSCVVDGKLQYVLTKFIGFRNKLGPITRRELQTELEMLRKLSDENLTEFLGTCYKEQHLILIWEEHKYSLEDVLFEHRGAVKVDKKTMRLTNDKLMGYACDILTALEYLHQNGVVHQNLTARSVFFGKNLKVAKVGNFCFVDGRREIRKKARENETTEQNVIDFAISYRAPETLRSLKTAELSISVFASDIYSFGVLLFELFEMKKAYENLTFDNFLKRLFAKVPRRPNLCAFNLEKLPNVLKDILTRCWQQNPELRPHASAVLEKIKFQLADEEEENNEEGEVRDPAMAEWLGEFFYYDE